MENKNKEQNLADLQKRMINIENLLTAIGEFLENNFSLGSRLIREKDIKKQVEQERLENRSAISTYLSTLRKKETK
ncbi:hypothetical protein KJ966_24720 [bacterium]|nr:hypothetical protein [bacterium]